MAMELLQSALVFGVNPWSSCCFRINRYHYSGARMQVKNSAAASSASSSSSKSNYFLDDDGYDSDEEKKKKKEEEEKAAELSWATRARQLAIQEMRSRNFNDRHFEALLPPHLRLSTQRRKKKKQEKMQAMQQLRPRPVAPVQKKKEKKRKIEDDEDDELVEHEPVDPMQLKALARKFNQPLDRALGRESVYDDDDENMEPQAKLSVVYSSQHEEPEGSEEESSKKTLIDDPRRGFILNRDLADARNVDEVLEAISRVQGRLKLTPVNISTALHRIAKNMVKVSMVETRRLIYARQPQVCELIASAMELLPESSAQGISNVAWALSKIGGSLLYYGEMEVVAQAAMNKAGEMNAQNVANIAGAFASMQHSNPGLFQKLAERGSEVAGDLKPQELAQLLWSFACLNRPADCLLDALDKLEIKLESIIDEEVTPGDGDEEEQEQDAVKREKFSFEVLSNIAWSCAVLGQLHRQFFRRICGEIQKFDENASVEQHQRRHLTQLYQVMMALKFEGNKKLEPITFGPKLEKFAAAAWAKEKSSRKKVSAFQREMQTFLAHTEKKWSREYEHADYSLDFAVRDERVALEVNGPSHFARNTGELLGHTALKHRLLSATGWRVISASYSDWENLEGEAEHIEFIHDLVAPYFQPKDS